MLTNVNKIFKFYDIKYRDIFSLNKNMIRQIIQEKNGMEDWRCNFIN